jgi:hypothetical protein
MQNDFFKWNNFVQQMKRQRGDEVEGQADKTALRGAQRVREARGISPPKQGQAGLTNG